METYTIEDKVVAGFDEATQKWYPIQYFYNGEDLELHTTLQLDASNPQHKGIIDTYGYTRPKAIPIVKLEHDARELVVLDSEGKALAAWCHKAHGYRNASIYFQQKKRKPFIRSTYTGVHLPAFGKNSAGVLRLKLRNGVHMTGAKWSTYMDVLEHFEAKPYKYSLSFITRTTESYAITIKDMYTHKTSTSLVDAFDKDDAINKLLMSLQNVCITDIRKNRES